MNIYISVKETKDHTGLIPDVPSKISYFAGPNCEVIEDKCWNCFDAGTSNCTSLPSDYICDCNMGYEGKNCSVSTRNDGRRYLTIWTHLTIRDRQENTESYADSFIPKFWSILQNLG